ncbi:rhamnan synthesis F family protein [Ancylobacter vacuolatus]|uniref:Lipopolysaccharide biosynthesis protein/glycosyltransferase involved in cell wall biosynthesis n=1 Tax=Ancylobacter vacuolatus TaxID=223389 RepID=A0ABU0DDC2_9HYPH|nr:rhamnan synthesis F family protein [Ancylobacter vacuolatus]MDQ0346409.1 lipopolysaccharide biosynthesis protein/glycosyltransferase involved in cell wall biosynthesis [Ancylobacter vacuolatus]
MGDAAYGEEYYRLYCGIPYTREEPHWQAFFAGVAQRIDEAWAPKTVFDAGCAIGFLVEALRARGIEAFGRDFSSYAIGQVPAGLQAYCECGSIADPIEASYDLVTCIEVVEHMPPAEAMRAIENMCRAAPRVLLSSTPLDFAEATHINVQPPLYWMRLFAQQGFGPRAEFDGSFLTPWAILFERRPVAPMEAELEVQARLVMSRIETEERKRRIAGLTAENAALERRLAAMATRSAFPRAFKRRIARLKERHGVFAFGRRKIAEDCRHAEAEPPALAADAAEPQTLAADAAQIEASGLFDGQWYLERYPDVPGNRQDALRHYIAYGAKEGRDPNPVFSTQFYVDTYQEVRASGLNPLLHYLTRGSAAGLKPSPDFDPVWYRDAYPHSLAAGEEPLQHYLREGWEQGLRRRAEDRVRLPATARIETIKVAAPADELVLFVTHAPGGTIKPHVGRYIDALKNCGLSVVLIIVADRGHEVDPADMADRVDGLVIRENGGLDFAAWAHVAGLVDLSGVRLLGLINDSLVGPFSDAAMQAVMARVRASEAQIVSLTDNYEFRHHLQSYFLVAKDQGVAELAAFLSGVQWLQSKQDVILSYELNVLAAFQTKGLTSEALFPSRGHTNPTTTQWRELIEQGFPFIKMAVLQAHAVAEWRSLLAANAYDPQLAEGSLAVIASARRLAAPPSGSGRPALPSDRDAAPLGQLREVVARWIAATARATALEQELSRSRRHPLRLVRAKLKFNLYTCLAALSPPLPADKAARYARRALKYDPARSDAEPGGSAAPPSVSMAGAARAHPGGKERDAEKKNILVVSHQASRTGAPILTLNIAQRLAEKYNVTILSLLGGEILEDFRAVAVTVIDANLHSMESAPYEKLIARLASETDFAFAIVNSVESHAVLAPLRQNGVPTVALLHEFAAYTGKRSAFPDAMRWADETVFSTQLTLDNAFDTNRMDFTPHLHVIAQGKCVVPGKQIAEAEQDAERAMLREVLSSGQDTLAGKRKRFQVLGAGTVEIRKGIDLFIETANRVLKAPGGEYVHFAWLGEGYAPDRDYAYSVYLRDQLQRAGIADRVTMLPATSEIELAYEMADVLLVSSRLDPLPNVGIDGLARGMPVLCFERATGIAELLTQAGLREACVADYLDTADMAKKLLALVRSEALCKEVSDKAKVYAAANLDLGRYVERLDALGLKARSRADKRAGDIETIIASGRFRADFFEAGTGETAASRDLVAAYIDRLGQIGAARKPEPGFNPYVYAQTLASGYDGRREAYADFLRKGRPPGPWMLEVLQGGEQAHRPGSAPAIRAALHLHAYFPERLREFAARLALNEAQPDLFISVGEMAAPEQVEEIFKRHRGRVVVRQTPNIGRDIAPLLSTFGPQLVEDYEVVGHVHIKRSVQLANAAMVSAWSDFLLENLLGGPQGGRMMDLVLGHFAQDPKVGLIYPDDPHIFGWTRNWRKAERLARAMGHAALPKAINFPIGTMFWMRTAALKPFVDLKLEGSDYPREPLSDDGTDLHALERLFGVIPLLEGWRAVVTNIRGVTR